MNASVALPSNEKRLMTLNRQGPLYILHLHNKDNRFTTESIKAILEALETVEKAFLACEDPTDMALVTIGEGKIYSNGLELSEALAYRPFMDLYNHLLKRMVTFCIPTVAAINGHAFAGGFLFAMAHDYRVMRSDRGFLCMNEIDLPTNIPAGMSALLRYKMSPMTYRNTALQGHRFAAEEALAQNLVDEICPGDQVFEKAKALATKWASKAQSGLIYKQIKDEMYREIVQCLSEPFHRFAPKM